MAIMAAVALALLAFVASTSAAAVHTGNAEFLAFVTAVKKIPQYSTFVKAMVNNNLGPNIAAVIDKVPVGITMLVPNNAAFQKIPPEKLSALSSDPAAAKQVFTLHVVGSYDPKATWDKFPLHQQLFTASGLKIQKLGPAMVGVVGTNATAKIVKFDVYRSKKLVTYTIDHVLIPF